ncbi:uncharacterized protein BJX67DRAFT_75931 [Aspergillus lucknowensis]|uniref:Uncharacterized protein n=1 Tax=Aspergillus lucknowensis TaxID=176173 RepID=A0ABR4LT16_9EURO
MALARAAPVTRRLEAHFWELVLSNNGISASLKTELEFKTLLSLMIHGRGWGGKIKKFLNVAWEARWMIWTIEDLRDSVEELNPANKVREPKDRNPLSPVLVEWTGGLQCTWIDLTNHKSLSGKSKALTEWRD